MRELGENLLLIGLELVLFIDFETALRFSKEAILIV